MNRYTQKNRGGRQAPPRPQSAATVQQNVEAPREYFDRDPFPYVKELPIAANASGFVSYANGNNEASEWQELDIQAPPACAISISRTEDNSDQTVMSAVRVEDLPVVDGRRTLQFRSAARDEPLNTRKQQSFVATVTNPYPVPVTCRLRARRNHIIFIQPIKVGAAHTRR